MAALRPGCVASDLVSHQWGARFHVPTRLGTRSVGGMGTIIGRWKQILSQEPYLPDAPSVHLFTRLSLRWRVVALPRQPSIAATIPPACLSPQFQADRRVCAMN